jgi:hypothetical protein
MLPAIQDILHVMLPVTTYTHTLSHLLIIVSMLACTAHVQIVCMMHSTLHCWAPVPDCLPVVHKECPGFVMPICWMLNTYKHVALESVGGLWVGVGGTFPHVLQLQHLTFPSCMYCPFYHILARSPSVHAPHSSHKEHGVLRCAVVVATHGLCHHSCCIPLGLCIPICNSRFCTQSRNLPNAFRSSQHVPHVD